MLNMSWATSVLNTQKINKKNCNHFSSECILDACAVSSKPPKKYAGSLSWYIFYNFSCAFVFCAFVQKGQVTHCKSVFLVFLQQQASPVYTGTPFPSILHSSRGQKRGHYTPRPLLNPVRRGRGLYSSLSSLHHREEETACGEEEEVEGGVLP